MSDNTVETLKPILHIRDEIELEMVKLCNNRDDGVDPSGLVLVELKKMYKHIMEFVTPYFGPELLLDNNYDEDVKFNEESEIKSNPRNKVLTIYPNSKSTAPID